MANHPPDSGDEQSGPNAKSGWPDLYAVLGVPADSDTETLRIRIRDAYIDATANVDHRNIERRIHFQTLVERIIPQSRRILLDPTLRARYDRENGRHQAGDPEAMSFAAFVQNLTPQSAAGEEEREQAPGTQSEFSNELEMLESEAQSAEADHTIFADEPEDAAPVEPATFKNEPLADAVTKRNWNRERPARNVVTSNAPTGGTDATPTPTAPPIEEDEPSKETRVEIAGPTKTQPNTAVTATMKGEAPVPPQPQAAGPVPTPTLEESSDLNSVEKSGDEPKEALYASVLRPEGPALEAHSTAHLNLEASPEARRQAVRNASRVSVGPGDDDFRAAGSRKPIRKSLISQRTQMLAIGICAALLILFILRKDRGGSDQLQLRIAYASDLNQFMPGAVQSFASTKAGKAIDVELEVSDSRDAMTSLLGNQITADAWVPAESIWSDRYNEVASSHKVKPIIVARSIALSPCVLIARGDHASTLHRLFPGGIVTSWRELVKAIQTSVPNHFGAADPTRSGAGAIARFFMAKEWCAANHVAWDKNAANNGALWQWLGGMEQNVPGKPSLSGDMVKELALATADRYWWAIGYESDAIAWMKQGKKVEVFYLPQTNYADHPLCFIDRPGAPLGVDKARSVFDAYLRSVPIQQSLAQSGLRPTEIELTNSIPDNPFLDPKFIHEGIKKDGFPAGERVNYRILNALAAAWAGRYN